MSFSINSFREIVNTATADSGFLTITNGNKLSTTSKLSGATASKSDPAVNAKVRDALFESLKTLNGTSEGYIAKIKELVYGKDDSVKNAELSALQARNIIDHAQAISGRLSVQLGKTLKTGPFPDNVNEMLAKTVSHQANNPIVRQFLERDNGNLYGLGRIAALAVKIFDGQDGATSQSERLAIAYLSGFASAIVKDDVDVVDRNQFDTGAGSVSDYWKMGNNKGLEESELVKDDMPQVAQSDDKNSTFECKNPGVGLKYKFKQYHQNGGGKNNCLLLSVLQHTKGIEYTTNNEAATLRDELGELLKDIQSDVKQPTTDKVEEGKQATHKYKGIKLGEKGVIQIVPEGTKDSSKYIVLPDTSNFGGVDGKSTEQMDFAAAALIAHKTGRPVVLVTTEADKDPVFMRFDIDLTTGKRFAVDDNKDNAIYVRYMPANRGKEGVDGHFEALEVQESVQYNPANAKKHLAEDVFSNVKIEGNATQKNILFTKIVNSMKPKINGADTDDQKIIDSLKGFIGNLKVEKFKTEVESKIEELMACLRKYNDFVKVDEDGKVIESAPKDSDNQKDGNDKQVKVKTDYDALADLFVSEYIMKGVAAK